MLGLVELLPVITLLCLVLHYSSCSAFSAIFANYDMFHLCLTGLHSIMCLNLCVSLIVCPFFFVSEPFVFIVFSKHVADLQQLCCQCLHTVWVLASLFYLYKLNKILYFKLCWSGLIVLIL